MPEKLHRCVTDMGLGMDSDKAWKICNSSIKEDVVNALAIAGVGIQEHHNPLDIPLGEQPTQEVCKPCEQDKSMMKEIMESKLGLRSNQ